MLKLLVYVRKVALEKLGAVHKISFHQHTVGFPLSLYKLFSVSPFSLLTAHWSILPGSRRSEDWSLVTVVPRAEWRQSKVKKSSKEQSNEKQRKAAKSKAKKSREKRSNAEQRRGVCPQGRVSAVRTNCFPTTVSPAWPGFKKLPLQDNLQCAKCLSVVWGVMEARWSSNIVLCRARKLWPDQFGLMTPPPNYYLPISRARSSVLYKQTIKQGAFPTLPISELKVTPPWSPCVGFWVRGHK